MQSLLIHGRLPGLSRVELESLFGSDTMQPVEDTATLLDVAAVEVPFARLGGTVKLARMLTILDTTDWRAISDYLINTVAKHAGYVPGGKLTIGLSVYGLPVKVEAINRTGLALKKVVKSSGRPVRVVPNKSLELNSAQVLHNGLTDERGWELLLVRHGYKTVLAQTVAIQDIESYAARDQSRPKRDARVGMLPPKLAQTIINLAKPERGAIVLDPFCGTGVVLQESLLMGYNAYGSDLEPRMVEYTAENLVWLTQRFNVSAKHEVVVADATTHTWPRPFDTVASETYLGRPFSAAPKPAILNEVVRDCDTINQKFLENLARQTPVGFRLCIAVPAWAEHGGFRRLPTLDRLEKIGYTRLSFKHTRNEELIYHRPGQIVGRELVVLHRT